LGRLALGAHVALGSILASALAMAAVREVAPGDLRAALQRAQAGDTLHLQPGRHAGPAAVEVGLRILGAPGAIIEGSGTGTVLTLAADDIELRDVTVRGSGRDLSADDAVVLVLDSHRVGIDHCRVEARAFGIYLRGGGDHRVTGNTVVGDPSLAVADRGNGIHLWHTTRNTVRGNVLEDVRDGVYLSFAHDNTIAENQGTGLRYGIHYMYSERNHLEANRFEGCSGGIALMFSMRNRIIGNVAVGNRQFGILCQQLEHSILSGNRVAGNGRGLYLQNSVDNRLEENRVEANGVGAFLTAGSELNVFTRNRFDGNLVQVYEDHPGANAFHADRRGNEWSDYAGFDWNGDGVGDASYRLQGAAASLMARRPVTRWFWMSPTLALLDWWQGRSGEAEPSATDPFPLVGGGPSR